MASLRLAFSCIFPTLEAYLRSSFLTIGPGIRLYPGNACTTPGVTTESQYCLSADGSLWMCADFFSQFQTCASEHPSDVCSQVLEPRLQQNMPQTEPALLPVSQERSPIPLLRGVLAARVPPPTSVSIFCGSVSFSLFCNHFSICHFFTLRQLGVCSDMYADDSYVQILGVFPNGTFFVLIHRFTSFSLQTAPPPRFWLCPSTIFLLGLRGKTRKSLTSPSVPTQSVAKFWSFSLRCECCLHPPQLPPSGVRSVTCHQISSNRQTVNSWLGSLKWHKGF